MKSKKTLASFFVMILTTVMITISCGPSKQDQAKSDSTVVDSLPAEGENAAQQDIVPQTLPSQLDTMRDSVDRKP
jgi:hypothetical protein